MTQAEQRLARILHSMEEACLRTGRNPSEVRLVAVSKKQSPEAIQSLVEAGHSLFGESRLQESMVKIPLLPGRLQWHFIGHLQKNKIRKALPLFSLFHGVDSVDLAREMERVASGDGHRSSILLEVNVSGESSKFGISPDQLASAVEEVSALPRIDLLGLMTMAPYDEDPEKARPYFRRLRELRDEVSRSLHVDLPELSMGMSGDFVPAVEEGATLVRIGTALFGSR